MVDSNQELYNQLQTFLNKYIQIADEKLEKNINAVLLRNCEHYAKFLTME